MNKAPVRAARRLRRQQTDAERLLWFRLRDRRFGGWKFRRQFPIDRYIVDFFCSDAHLVIELDGGQHAVQTDADAARTKVFEAMGYLVSRFWNNDVMRNIEGVLEEIMVALTRSASEPPHPTLFPPGRGYSITDTRNA
jgi:very-short-patch-repair endonuclease